MNETEAYFHAIGSGIKKSERSQMFGKLCYKRENRAFCCFFENCMVFKLQGEMHELAIKLEGAQLFDPSRKGRPMKAWVQVPFTHCESWRELAESAANDI